MTRCTCGECITAQPNCLSDVLCNTTTIGTVNEDYEMQWTSLHAEALQSSLSAFWSAEMYDNDTAPLQLELVTDISDKRIDSIVHSAPHISTVEDLCNMTLCSIWENESDILGLITKVKSMTVCKSDDQ